MTIKDKKYQHNIDLLGLILKNWQIQSLTADPGTTYARLYYNSVSHTLRWYDPNSSSWADITGSGGFTQEQIEDFVGAMITPGNNIDVTYNDGAGTITIDVEALTSSDISDFNTQVRTSRLDQMTAPSSDVSMNSHKITNLSDAGAATDAVNLGQVQGLINTGTNKTSVRVTSTANVVIASALENGDSLDGVTLATGDRVLLKNQSTPSQNGIYIVVASGTAARATDADIDAEVKAGLSVWVNEGTAGGDTRWVLTTDDPIVLNTTSLTFVQDFKASATTAGAGLVLNGAALDVGQGTGITVNANDIAINTSVVVTKFAATIGDNSTTDIVVNHALNTRDVTVQVWDAASPFSLQSVYVEATDVNNVTIFFPTAPTTNQYRVVVKA